MLATVVWRLAPELRRETFLRFGRIATALVAVLVLAGTVLSIERLQAPSDLWESSYGRVLAVKLALVALALGWGGVHHVLVRPRLERDARIPGGRVGSSLLGESTAAVVVLLAAAVLVNGTPPSAETGPGGGVQVAGAP
jgi:putative copper export protein